MKKILIIEDDPATVAGLSDTLTDEHFEVSTVMSGQMGYERAKEGDFDLIILDTTMSELASLEAVKIIRQLEEYSGQRAAIVGFGVEEDGDKCLEHGVDGYIHGSLTEDKIRAQLELV